VGAGNGILSLFSAQAGARKVYAVEASNMVQNLQHFMDAGKASKKLPKNTWLGDRIKPVHCEAVQYFNAT
jgi:histone-arginine methyltransferase CARM1